MEGDSIALGQGLQPTQIYGWTASHSFSTTYAYYNQAGGADTTANVISRESADEAILNSFADPFAYTLGVGANDLANSGLTPAATYANIQSICSSITAAVAGVKIILMTVLPGNFSGSTFGSTFELNRQALNTLERTGGTCPMILADVGNDATIGQAGQWSNATYYQADGIHPTAAGDAIISSYDRTGLVTAGFGP